MKTTYMICAAGIASAIVLLTEPLTAQAPDAEPAGAEATKAEAKPAKAPEQKLVRVYESSSMLMRGDPEIPKAKAGYVLPGLLADGWRIVKMDTGAAGNNSSMATTGYLLLER